MVWSRTAFSATARWRVSKGSLPPGRLPPLADEMKYEELFGLKNILAKYHGDNPVMIKLPETDGYSTRIMTSSIFWVRTTNDLVNNLKHSFPNRVDVKIDTLETPLSV